MLELAELLRAADAAAAAQTSQTSGGDGEGGDADEAAAAAAQQVVAAFCDADGPSLLYELASSMSGDWMTDARNGTTQLVTELGQLPGPAGAAIAQERTWIEEATQQAVTHDHSSHAPPGPEAAERRGRGKGSRTTRRVGSSSNRNKVVIGASAGTGTKADAPGGDSMR